MAVENTPRAGLKKFTSGTDPHPSRTDHNTERSLFDAIMAIAVQGATGDRPPAGVERRFFWDTTVKRLYWDDGSSWQEVTTNGGGGAGTAVVPGAAASEGTSVRSARADHTHSLVLATSSISGALSASDKAKLDGATSSSSASRVVIRDAAGRAQFTNPAAGSDAATKSYVDTEVNTAARATHTHDADDIVSGVLAPARLPVATQTAAGSLSAPDKLKLDRATPLATPSTIVMLDSAGRAQITSPLNGADITNKVYVDGQIDTRAATVHTHTWAQITNPPATYTPSAHTHDAGDIVSGVLSPARLPAATVASQGAMLAADKAKLDAASYDWLGPRMVIRNASGRAQFNTPSAGFDAANKEYVDNVPVSWGQLTEKPELVSLGYADIHYAAKNHGHYWSEIYGATARMNWGGSFTQVMAGSGKITVYNTGIFQAPGVYDNSVSGGSYRAVWVNSSGYMGYNISSRRYKTNEKDYAPDPSVLQALQPKWFQYIKDVEEVGAAAAPWRVNFIAEDLEEAGLQEYVSYDEEGKPETINEQLMVNVLWSLLQGVEKRLTAGGL